MKKKKAAKKPRFKSVAGPLIGTPDLCVPDAAKAIEFYERAFGAVETNRWTDARGKIGHAEFKIGDTLFFIADAPFPESEVKTPEELSGSSVVLGLNVPNADEVFERAVALGSKVIFPLADQFYGYRSGRVQDPFGHLWIISTKIEDVSQKEMGKRMGASSKQQ